MKMELQKKRTFVAAVILRIAMAAALLMGGVRASYGASSECVEFAGGRFNAASSSLAPTWFITDHIGSVRSVISNDGTILQQNDYYPYGERHGNERLVAGSNRWQFGGKENQRALGYNAYDFGARFYNHLQWTTMDPMAEKYYGLSPYAYCMGNPVKFIDPDGKDGVISIYGNVIMISTNVYLYGNGATNAVLQQMQNDINRIWGGSYAVNHNGKQFYVNFHISLSLYGGKEKDEPSVIADSWNPFSRNNYIEVSNDCHRSYVRGGDEGQWRSTGRNGKSLSQDDPAPHEVGHLLGLPDKYTDDKGPDKGWENNIMGNSREGNVDDRNVFDILENVWIKYDTWINKGNKGVFKYEINP